MMSKKILIYLSVILLFCCCSKQVVLYPEKNKIYGPHTTEKTVRDRLYAQYNSWQGTPYKKGGLSKHGVDCSGLIHLIFRDLFRTPLPRTTLEQRKLGVEVSLNNLQPGDLLYFKTGWFTHHVGIYLDNKRFLHASTSKGVMISNLQEDYWQSHFYLAKRLDIH